MPINDPIRGKKVAPKSLAFEGGRTARALGATSYQTEITNQQTVINNYYADPREAKRLDEAQNALIWQAERRAKHQVGQFGDVTLWDISATQSLDLGTWSRIPFNNEVLRVQGARISDTGWYHKIVKGDQGVYWYYAHIAINMPALASVSEAKLGIWRNGTLYYVVDQIDTGYAGETPIRDVILRGGVHLNLNRGDYVDFRLWTTIPGVPGSQSFMYPTSIGGYVTGHRVKCNQEPIGSTSEMDQYGFV
jgi:hypothetical protein